MKVKLGRPPTPVSTRFWAKVVKQKGGCWIFTSTHGGTDYGMLSVSSGEEYLAHRISWEIHNGKIPNGLLVLHHCDVPKCVNPDHLYLGTRQQNMDDMVSRGRSVTGEKHPNHKLTRTQIKTIRERYSTGKYSQQSLADSFGVHQTNIGFIVRNKTWIVIEEK